MLIIYKILFLAYIYSDQGYIEKIPQMRITTNKWEAEQFYKRAQEAEDNYLITDFIQGSDDYGIYFILK